MAQSFLKAEPSTKANDFQKDWKTFLAIFLFPYCMMEIRSGAANLRLLWRSFFSFSIVKWRVFTLQRPTIYPNDRYFMTDSLNFPDLKLDLWLWSYRPIYESQICCPGPYINGEKCVNVSEHWCKFMLFFNVFCYFHLLVILYECGLLIHILLFLYILRRTFYTPVYWDGIWMRQNENEIVRWSGWTNAILILDFY